MATIGDRDPDPDGGSMSPPRVEASYISSLPVIERETRAVHRDLEARPRYWRSFVLRRVGALVLLVAVLVGLVVAGFASWVGAARGGGLMLVAMALLTALDVWNVRRRTRSALRATVTAGCPPGTLVRADYGPEEVRFALPLQTVVLDVRTLTGARHQGGVLLLHQGEDTPAWVVPDELLGPDGLAYFRAILDGRLLEG